MDKSINIDGVYKWLVRNYAYKVFPPHNPLNQLNVDIANLQHEGKSRERAVLELALQIGLRILEIEELEEKGKSEEETISEFLKDEKLHLTEQDPEIQEVIKEVWMKQIYKPL